MSPASPIEMAQPSFWLRRRTRVEDAAALMGLQRLQVYQPLNAFCEGVASGVCVILNSDRKCLLYPA
jgi:hypothetical protein